MASHESNARYCLQCGQPLPGDAATPAEPTQIKLTITIVDDKGRPLVAPEHHAVRSYAQPRGSRRTPPVGP